MGSQLDNFAVAEATGEFQDIPDGGASKAIEALVFIADNAEVSGAGCELGQELFLNLVRSCS